MIVDCAMYAGGRQVDVGAAAADAPTTGSAALLEAARAAGGFVWIGLHEPTQGEFDHVTEAFDLHPLAVEDAIHAHQRPKLEHYGDSLFAVLKPARYVDSQEVVEIGQIMVFVGRDFVVTVRYGEPAALAGVRNHLEADAQRLAWGPSAVLHAVADRVADAYAEVMLGVEADIDQIEVDVFSGPRATHAERIFKLKREVLDFRRAVEPLEPSLAKLAEGDELIDERAAPYFRDVHDHVLRVAERLVAADALLDSALNANVAQVGMRRTRTCARSRRGWRSSPCRR